MTGLFCFGLGFCARALSRPLAKRGWRIAATMRSAPARSMEAGVTLPFDSVTAVSQALANYSHVLVSIPPNELGDPVLTLYRNALLAARDSIHWIGYLSTTAVYGDRGGAWVDETADLSPTTERGKRRLAAEQAWLELHSRHDLPVHIFRLAGIYGPGRNQLLAVAEGRARRIVKEGQVFSRIHVADVAGVLAASMASPHPGRCYNVCDDEPAPPQYVVAFAAELLGASVPPEVPFAEAQLVGLSGSFYEDSKRVSNRRIKEELGYRLLYPNYREGLKALMPSP